MPPGKLEGMNHAIGQASGLVKRLLTLSRRVGPEMTPLDLNRQVARAMELLERTIPKMIAMETRPADDLRAVNADPGQIEQLLINLGANARDAMPGGGGLVVETRNIELDEDFCRVHPDCRPGDYVQLLISDTGCGIDETTMEHIFEPFFTTKKVGEGSGLGLFTAYGIVKAHGGVMTVDSRLGKGTTFRVYLPALSITPEAIAAKTEIEADVPHGRELVLLVDDEKAIIDIAGEALRNHGYRTIAATNGEMAIETYRAMAGEIALVVLDLGMPGMGGLNCLEQLKQLDPKVRVLVATGYSSEGLSQNVIEAGALGYVGKPYKIADFLSRVRDVLDEDIEMKL
jgi:CheY-like chemotaxis protein